VYIRRFALMGLILMMGTYASAQEGGGIPRTPDGRPDLTGTYDANTLTPLERPAKLGDRRTLTDQEAAELLHAQVARAEEADKPSDPNRKAPKAGTIERSTSGSGSYNDFWKSFGNRVVTIGGEKRSSIIIDPANGRIPPMTEEGNARDDSFGGLAGRTDVLERRGDTPNAFDDPELRVNSERCLMGWGWTAGTPILPNYQYNNLKQIVQTPNEVMIVTEMIHDARVVRIGGQHLPSSIRKWLGDSIGHWDGDTLVVETTNFTDKTRFHGASENLKITERLTRPDANTLLYHFTVEDPHTWAHPWTGEYTWVTTNEKMYEYACHENNYSMGGILRGARLQEADKAASKTGTQR
jgi:hypothetical protein